MKAVTVSKVVFGGRSQARSKCSIVESNEIFAKHSVGTGKITPSNIRSGQGKNRTRRGRGRKAVPYECRRVQSIGCPNMEESVYCYTNWGDDQCDPPQSPEDDGIPICIDDGWEEIDNNGDVSDIVILNEKGEFVLAKISKAHSQSISDLKRRHWRSIRERLPGLLRGKPNILRGQKRGGISSLYACFGFRKDPLSSGKVGEYAYKQSASQATRAELDELVNRLTHNLEKIGGFFLKKMPETNEFKAVREELSIPSVSGEGVSTQFSIGRGYWSKAHVDDDYFFTHLSVLSSQDNQHDDVLYYFCFPQYKVKVPLRSAEVLVFNPLELHSCSNCKYDDAFIFSAYTSKKTVMTCGIGKCLGGSC